MEQPLLEDEEKPAPSPIGASSGDLISTTESGVMTQRESRSWRDWLSTSPMVPMACCIFLCFILKVVQQVDSQPHPGPGKAV